MIVPKCFYKNDLKACMSTTSSFSYNSRSGRACLWGFYRSSEWDLYLPEVIRINILTELTVPFRLGSLAAFPLISTDELFNKTQWLFWHFIGTAWAAPDRRKSTLTKLSTAGTHRLIRNESCKHLNVLNWTERLNVLKRYAWWSQTVGISRNLRHLLV